MSADLRDQLYRNLDQKTTDELIEIWQTNDQDEWSEMTFEVIREILIQRLAELPPQNEPITAASARSNGQEESEAKTGKSKFNWRLPLWGAIGFGLGFAVMGAIMLTIYNSAVNSFARAFGEVKVGLEVGAFRGVIVGMAGGAGLGFALKDKTRFLYLALAGALGFGIAFALVISIDSFLVSQIGWVIIGLVSTPAGYSSLAAQIARGLGAQGLGMGAMIGAIGGAVLGLATPKYRAISALLLCFAGIIAFGTVFAFGDNIFDGHFYSSWNAVGGALAGAALGIALALHYLIADGLDRKRVEPTGMSR
jgi:hypothetical protein